MADIDFPCGLPRPLRAPSTQTVQDLTYTNDVAGGPPLVELQDDQGWSNISVEWIFTRAQYQAFVGFHRVILRRGSKLFNLTVKDLQSGDEPFEVYMRTYTTKTVGPFVKVGTTLIALDERLDDCLLESIYVLHNSMQSPVTIFNDVDLIIQSIENDNG